MTVARNTAFNLAGAALPLVVALVTVPLYVRAIGLDRYGILAICWLLLGYLNLFDLGLGRAVSQRIASLGEGHGPTVNRIFWSAFAASAVLAIMGGFAFLPVASWTLERMSDASSPLRGEIAAAAPWLAVTLPLGVLSGILTGALEGRSRFLILNVLNSATALAGSLLPLAVAIWRGPDLASLLACAVLVRVASLVAGFAACWRTLPLARPTRPSRSEIRSLLTFGGWATVTSVIGPLMVFFDRFAIGLAVSAAAVAVYVIPFNLVAQLQVVPAALASALSPRLAASAPAQSRALASDALDLLVWILTPLTLGLLVVVGPFLHLWLDAATARAAEPVAYILLLGFWANSLGRIAYAQLHAQGRPDLTARVHLLELVPYVLTLLLALTTLGVPGAALAWSLRSAADAAILIRLSRARVKVVSTVVSVVLLAAAVAVCLALPVLDPRRWFLLAPMLLIVILHALLAPPARVGPLVASLAGKVPIMRWVASRWGPA